MDLSRDIHPLTDFKKNTPEFLRQMKETGEPIVLTINGKAELVVQDAASYQKLLELAEEAQRGRRHPPRPGRSQCRAYSQPRRLQAARREEARDFGLMFRIEVTANAQADADAAYAWMAENISPAFAEQWYQGLFKQLETLTKHPTRCPSARVGQIRRRHPRTDLRKA